MNNKMATFAHRNPGTLNSVRPTAGAAARAVWATKTARTTSPPAIAAIVFPAPGVGLHEAQRDQPHCGGHEGHSDRRGDGLASIGVIAIQYSAAENDTSDAHGNVDQERGTPAGEVDNDGAK